MKPDYSHDSELLAAYDEQLRIQIEYPEARKETTKDVVRFTRRPPGMNFVSYTFAGEGELERVIDEQSDYFLSMDQPFTWKVYAHDRRPGLEKKLAQRGFAADEEDPGEVMVLQVDQVPPALLQPVSADVRQLVEPGGLTDVVTVLDRVYGNDNAWVYERLGGHLAVPGYLSVYLACVDGQPAAVAWTYFPRGEFALLFAGSTLAEYRKQGLYTGLLAARLQEIRRRGYRYAVVEAGSMSQPIVAKHEFHYLTTMYDFEWAPSPALPQKREELLG